ncbi:MAG: histidine ammonia-lyase [Bacteroidota bacterium]
MNHSINNSELSMSFRYGIDSLTVGIIQQILSGDIKGILDEEARHKISASATEVDVMAAGDKSVYGINTGFGPLCNTRISPENTVLLQRKILLSHSVGVGNPISTDLARIMMILKVHALAQGYSGVSLNVIERIVWHIQTGIVSYVPEQGSVGASGDLAPLSHLFLPLLGEGKLWYEDQWQASAKVLQKFDLAPVTLAAKDGLGLINGTQFIAAHAVQLVAKLHNCLNHADIIGAMMIEGLQGSQMPFYQGLHQLRPYKGNLHVAHRIYHLLGGSEIMEAHKDCDKVQDPYSLRCIPQVHGASRNAWLHLKESTEIEINAVTDNPIVFSRDLTVSGGNFHGQPLALPIDYACLAASEIGNISDRRTYLSLEGKYEGTPRLLLEKAGLDSGFMILQYTSAALASENKGLCMPASADSIPTSMGQEDHVSMGSIGGRKALKVVENLEKILAIELLCAAQAFDFRAPLKSSPIIEAMHAQVRKSIAHAAEDRIFGDDIEKALNIIQTQELIPYLHAENQSISSPYDELFEIY